MRCMYRRLRAQSRLPSSQLQPCPHLTLVPSLLVTNSCKECVWVCGWVGWGGWGVGGGQTACSSAGGSWTVAGWATANGKPHPVIRSHTAHGRERCCPSLPPSHRLKACLLGHKVVRREADGVDAPEQLRLRIGVGQLNTVDGTLGVAEGSCARPVSTGGCSLV